MLEQILTTIKEMNPIYKELIIDYTSRFEKKDKNFVCLICDKITKYIDFDNKYISFKDIIVEGVYNLNNIKPSLIIVKREVGACRNKFLFWGKQYEVKYVCYITYEINGKKYIEKFIMDTAWENEDNEENGEKYRKKLEDEKKFELNNI